MDWVQVVILAVLQGFTEFLPISSSAHLILLPLLVDWPDQGLAFDIAVHVGTLLAVLVYFRRDLSRMFRDWLRFTRGAPSGRRQLLGVVPGGGYRARRSLRVGTDRLRYREFAQRFGHRRRNDIFRAAAVVERSTQSRRAR